MIQFKRKLQFLVWAISLFAIGYHIFRFSEFFTQSKEIDTFYHALSLITNVCLGISLYIILYKKEKKFK